MFELLLVLKLLDEHLVLDLLGIACFGVLVDQNDFYVLVLAFIFVISVFGKAILEFHELEVTARVCLFDQEVDEVSGILGVFGNVSGPEDVPQAAVAVLGLLLAFLLQFLQVFGEFEL